MKPVSHSFGFATSRALALLLLSSSALLAGKAAAEDAYVEGEVLVTFKSGVATETAKTALGKRALGLTQKFDHLSARRNRVSAMVREKARKTKDLIADLKDDPDVETVEPNYIRRVSAVSTADPDFSKLWGLHNTGQTVNGSASTSGVDTKFSQAWALARPNPSEVVVAVVDTGVDITHPDLAANIWTNPGEIPGNSIDDDGDGRVDDVHGYDFASNTAIMTDSGEHGTHVAGTIAAIGQNGIGVIGVGYKAKILPLKVSTDGETLSTSAVLAALDYMVALKERGVNIVAANASYGGGSSSTSERQAIEALRDAGIVFCAAAGNETANNDTTPSYPANYTTSNIISVAATTQTNGLASFSNYGATTVDIGAPGANIYSAMPLSMVSQTSSLKIGNTTYAAASLEFSGSTVSVGLTKPLYSCSLGRVGDFPAAVSGNIALIQRGTITFAEKVTNAMNAGAVAAVIYDNTSSSITTNPWTLGTTGSWIPAIRISMANGQTIAASTLPVSSTLTEWVNTAAAYQYLDGTSMATPHVTGAVAFAAMNFPGETMAQRISRILNNTTPVAALSGKTTTGGMLNLQKMIDTDGDGLPDWWETEQFGSLAQAGAGDLDQDGFTNADEYLAGTSPVNASSKLGFSLLSAGTGNSAADFVLDFPTVADRSYQVEWSNDLIAWSVLGNTITGTGSPVEVRDTGARTSSTQRFYRLRLITP
ncbi:S8 family serine peptidase [Haloferula sp. BvORR071]|uniref:S8 family serine peptidase n=1 Tax=Haloferula sp. BvORR071 TaxID=1396141 RepID=UPI000696FC2E|nr:S8 family serine peptidase [Haloferula sp. BvORR071]